MIKFIPALITLTILLIATFIRIYTILKSKK